MGGAESDKLKKYPEFNTPFELSIDTSNNQIS